LVAHDNKKQELFEWVKRNCKVLAEHSLYATGATGQLLKSGLGLNVTRLESGPLGGDQQIGSRISEGQIDFVIFFSDPLEPQAHDADVKALLRIAVVWNIPVACNRASADFIISSPLMSTVYERLVPDYSNYRSRLAIGGAHDAARAVEQLRAQLLLDLSNLLRQGGLGDVQRRCRAGEAAVVHDGDQVASVAEQHVITPTYRDSKETVLDTYTTGAQI
jgi:methylglyoxal synthase